MPLPALPILAALWAAKTGGTYYGYKKLKDKNPELVEEWGQKARDLKGQVKDILFGNDKNEGDPPPSP